MTFTTIVSGIFAVAKAWPTINEWIHKFVDEWTSKQVHEDDQTRVSFLQEKKALDRAIARAESNDDIKYLSITLRRLNNNKLPKNTSTIL